MEMLLKEGALRERFLKAVAEKFVFIETTDLPDDLKDEVEGLKQDVTKAEPTSGTDRMTPTIDGLSDGEVSQFADRLVALAFRMVREDPRR